MARETHSSTVIAKSRKDAVRKLKGKLLRPRDWAVKKVELESVRKMYKVTFIRRKRRQSK